MKFRYSCFLLFFAFFLSASAYSADFEDNTYMADVEWPSLLSKISQTKDSRKAGVSYERDKVLALKQTSPGESLDELSKPGLHSITLHFDSDSPTKEADSVLHYIIDSGVSPQSSWDIVVGGGGGCKGNITLLSEAIRVLPLINALHWITPSPIPPVILRSLEASHPKCRLSYELDFWSGSGRNHQNWFPYSIPINETTSPKEVETLNGKNWAASLHHIINSNNLYSLKAPIVYGYQSTSSSMDLVFDILTSCPNLRELDLSINDYGCEFSDQAPYSFNFQRINMTLRPVPLPPLEVLKLDGYIFDTRPDGEEWDILHGWEETRVYRWPWNKLPISVTNWIGYGRIHSWGGAWSSWAKFPPDDEKLEDNNLDTWLQAMDWSHLHTLSISRPTPETLRKLSGDTLPSLKNATFDAGYEDAVIPIFELLSNTSSPLKSITIESITYLKCPSNPSRILDVIAKHHCPTLHTLKLTHESSKEPRDGLATSYDAKEWQHPTSSFISSTLLSQLRDSCPDLQNLEIDIESRDEWDYELLDALASFTELKNLTLRFEPERAGQVYKHDDFDTHEQRRMYEALVGPVIAGLKGYLRERKMGVPFEKVEVWIGWEKF
jgi:hypothetical protein